MYSSAVGIIKQFRNYKMIALVVSVICLFRLGAAYQNAYDQDLNFECPHQYQSVSHVESVHDSHREDRMFGLTCSDVIHGGYDYKTSCYSTGWQNDYDQLLAFQCTGNHYISGMHSHHNSHHEDRIWWFKCCQVQDVHMVDCVLTDWTNAYDGAQYFNVPAGKVMKGVTSIHDNHKEDRLYKYEICRVLQTDGSQIVGK